MHAATQLAMIHLPTAADGSHHPTIAYLPTYWWPGPTYLPLSLSQFDYVFGQNVTEHDPAPSPAPVTRF